MQVYAGTSAETCRGIQLDDNLTANLIGLIHHLDEKCEDFHATGLKSVPCIAEHEHFETPGHHCSCSDSRKLASNLPSPRLGNNMAQQFILTEATSADCEAIAVIEFSACASDPGFSTIFPHGATPTLLADYVGRFQSDLADDPTCHMYVVRESASSEVVSFATWHFFPDRTQEEIDAQMLLDDFHLPEDANREAGNLLIRNGLRKRHELMGRKAYAYLAATGTALGWRRQGAASLLLTHGLFMADRQGLSTYVEGTLVAKGLYGKFGFVEVDRLKLEVGPWKQGEYWNVCMARPANNGLSD